MKLIYTAAFIVLSHSLLLAQHNTILIIADDVSPDYFGCFSKNTDTAMVPNISALSKKSVRFSKVWASPVCSPTRAGILTGQYSFRTGVGQVITGTASPQLDTNEVSLASLLKKSAPKAYQTACVGKWHLNNNQPIKRTYPNKLGYDFYSGNFNGAITDYYKWTRIKNGIQDTVKTYATTQTINDAISWLDTLNKNRPFFLWVAFNAPHSPYHLPPSSLCNTTGLSGTTAHINANPALYFKAAIEAMDSEIGRLFQYLINNNLMDSTHIIFMGDNGNATQVAQISNRTKAKGTIYDYGVRVPFMVAGPSVVSPNRVSNELINTPDLFATIAELSGFPNWRSSIPKNKTIDSRSFLPLLKNQTYKGRTWIFTEQFASPAAASDGKTIRNESYHLLRFDTGKEEFYNQTSDPEENNNLLLNTLSTTELTNYRLLCDSLKSLTGLGNCQTSAVNETRMDQRIYKTSNPFGNRIEIPLNSNPYVRLTNAIGQTVYMGREIENQDFTGLPKGIYFIKIGSGPIQKLMKN